MTWRARRRRRRTPWTPVASPPVWMSTARKSDERDLQPHFSFLRIFLNKLTFMPSLCIINCDICVISIQYIHKPNLYFLFVIGTAKRICETLQIMSVRDP